MPIQPILNTCAVPVIDGNFQTLVTPSRTQKSPQSGNLKGLDK